MAAASKCLIVALELFCLLLSFCNSKKSDPSFAEIEAAENCATEHRHGITYADEIEREYKVGSSVNVKCNPNHPLWKELHDINDSEFSMYPNSTIQCQNGGTWSIPLPICIRKAHYEKSNITVKHKSFYDCSDGSHHISKKCPQNIEDWVPVDVASGTCQIHRADASNVKTRRVLFDFSEQHYLRMITFSLPLKIHGIWILVDEKSARLSDDALRISKQIYVESKMEDEMKISSTTNNCPVTILAVHTNKLVVEISMGIQDFLKTSIENISSHIIFYPIVQGMPTNQTPLGYCPDPPTIPNANWHNITTTEEPNTHVLLYVCDKDHVLYDPTSKSLSDGKLTCIGDDWSPHPFPICRRIQTWSNGRIGGLTEDSNSNPSQCSSADCVCFWCCLLSVFGAVALFISAIYVFRKVVGSLLVSAFRCFVKKNDTKKQEEQEDVNQQCNSPTLNLSESSRLNPKE